MTNKFQALGDYIREHRQTVGIATQGEFAQRLDKSQQTVSRWEAGVSRPGPNELPKLAAVLKVDATELSLTAGYIPTTTTVSFDQPLPLPSLAPTSFEYFCLDLLATYFGERADVHPAGKTGHKQYGIDIDARLINGDLHTYQCKREAAFGPSKVRDAIAAQTIAANKKHILLSRTASPDARSEISKMPDWDLWDQIDITRIFRQLPKREQVRLSDIYFPTQRFALTGELTAGPWQGVTEFFAPQLIEGGVFNQCWNLVGRTAELAELEGALADHDTVTISLIGRAGEGKSRVLRAALEAFASTHSSIRVVIASPTEEITAKSLEDLGGGRKLIVADDVHDRTDLVQLIRYVANRDSEARLLLVYRPYWIDTVQRELARYALAGTAIKSITLSPPTKQDGIALATQALTTYGASTASAEAIATLAYDSPLAIVVGAYIVATEGLHPELFGSSSLFRAAVLKHYEKAIAEGIAKGKDQDRVHAILRVIALVQPIVPDDKHILDLLAHSESIQAADASRLIRLLIDAGVLFKRGAKFRLSPDLLADSIIESACISTGGQSNGYAEEIFEVSIAEYKEHVLLNLGRLDWRRNEGDTSSSSLLDGLWSQLKWQDDYVNAQVRAAAAAAYFQPRQALAFARRLIDEEHSKNEDICRIIRGASYHLQFLEEACALLWELGQNDARQLHQHPDHPIRILTELATAEPDKPAEFVDGVVDFALSLVEYAESWAGAYTPFDILKGTLATEGHFSSATTSRTITLTTYAVRRERVKQARHRIITELLSSLSHSNPRRAFLAAQHLNDAIRGPIARDSATPDEWGDEFAETLEKIDTAHNTTNITAVTLVRIATSVHWHAIYGPDRTKAPAQQVFAHLNRDLPTRTIRALMDTWGTDTWPTDENRDRSQHKADIASLCRELRAQHSDPAQLAQFLNECLEDIASAVKSHTGHAATFLSHLFEVDQPLALHIVNAYLRAENTQLSPHTGRALGSLLSANRGEAAALIEVMLAHSDAHLQVIAEGYVYATAPWPYSNLDQTVFKNLFASKNAPVLQCAALIARDIAKNDTGLAIELIASADLIAAPRSVDDFFMLLTHDEAVPFELITDAQLQRLVDSLRHISRMDHYWINAFLKKAIRRIPGAVLKLAMQRIDDAIRTNEWYSSPLGDMLRGEDTLELMSLPEGPKLLLSLLDSGLQNIDNYKFSHQFSELIQVLCSPYDEACVATMEKWLAEGGAAHFKVIAAILREAGREFIYKNGEFIASALGSARSISRQTYKDLNSAIQTACVTGVRSGIPGEPFETDVELKALAEQRLALLTKSHPAFELYQGLRDWADREIERQLKKGKIMDEEDMAR